MPHTPVRDASWATAGRPNCVAEPAMIVPNGVKPTAYSTASGHRRVDEGRGPPGQAPVQRTVGEQAGEERRRA